MKKIGVVIFVSWLFWTIKRIVEIENYIIDNLKEFYDELDGTPEDSYFDGPFVPPDFEGSYIINKYTGRPLTPEKASETMEYLADYIEAYNKKRRH